MTTAEHDDRPQEWVRAYCANIRRLGAQMTEALREFNASRGSL